MLGTAPVAYLSGGHHLDVNAFCGRSDALQSSPSAHALFPMDDGRCVEVPKWNRGLWTLDSDKRVDGGGGGSEDSLEEPAQNPTRIMAGCPSLSAA